MTSMTEASEVMKVDRRGRVHVPMERREALLDEFERSGASAPEFARLVGVKYATFAGWRAQRAGASKGALQAGTSARQRAMVSPPAVHLFEAVVEAPPAPPDSGLAVELPGRGRLVITAPAQLAWAAELLRLLDQTGGRRC